MKRKFLAVVLLICLALVAVPMVAWAAESPVISGWAYHIDDWYSSSDREQLQEVLDAFYGTMTTVPGQPVITGAGMAAAVEEYAATVEYTVEGEADGGTPLEIIQAVVKEDVAAEDVTIAVMPYFDLEINGYSADFTTGFEMESMAVRIDSMVRVVATLLTPEELAAGKVPQVYFEADVPDSIELGWGEELPLEGDLQIKLAIPAGLTTADTIAVVLENEKGNYLYEAAVEHHKDHSLVSFTSTDGVGNFNLIFDEECVPDDSYFGEAEDLCVCTMFYVDINNKGWYHEAVEYAIYNTILNGDGDKFMPTFDVTRGMMAQILYNIEGWPEAGEPAFADVPADMWYSDAIAWAADKDVFAGYGDNVFGPEKVLTREQAAEVLYNYAKYKGYDVSVGEDTNILSYEDAFDISDWAFEAIQWAVGADIMNGKPGDILDPQGSLTRAEIAQLMMAFSEKYVSEF